MRVDRSSDLPGHGPHGKLTHHARGRSVAPDVCEHTAEATDQMIQGATARSHRVHFLRFLGVAAEKIGHASSPTGHTGAPFRTSKKQLVHMTSSARLG